MDHVIKFNQKFDLYVNFSFATTLKRVNIVSSPVVVNPSYSTTIQSIPELQRPLRESTEINIVNSRQTQQISTTVTTTAAAAAKSPLFSTYHPAMSKNNEPVKLVYPSKIPNGTINLATIPSQSQQQSNIMHTSTSMATNAGSNTITGQQPQTIVIKNQVLNIFWIYSFSVNKFNSQFSYSSVSQLFKVLKLFVLSQKNVNEKRTRKK